MVESAATLCLEKPDARLAELDFDLPSLPEVLVVPDMLTDEQTRARAARFIGAVVLGTHDILEAAPIQAPIKSLQEAIKLAQAGDKEGRALVEASVGTDVIERTIKTGHVMNPVRLAVTSGGKIIQHGQSMDSVQANSLRYAADHPLMRARTEAETRNAFRMEELNRAGFFDDYCFVVISRAENLPEAGFFTDTMSCCIQVTGKDKNSLATESAFVSGIATRGGEQHDAATIVQMGRRLGVDFARKSPADIIDMPLLIRKDLIPHGAIDLVWLYDESAGGTFFGETAPRQDYVQYLETCRRRERSFAPKIAAITEELLGQANSIHSPVEAIEKLHQLSEKHMVEKAIADTTIDPRVFGNVAAGHIEQARLAAAQGDQERLDHYMQKAKDTAQSSSCPSGKIRSIDELEDPEAAEKKAESDEDCDFISKECPQCKKKNVKTTVTKTHISGDCGCRVKR